MSTNDEENRKARAKHLRETISELADLSKEPKQAEAEKKAAPVSPREFIHRKMRELDKDEEP